MKQSFYTIEPEFILAFFISLIVTNKSDLGILKKLDNINRD